MKKPPISKPTPKAPAATKQRTPNEEAVPMPEQRHQSTPTVAELRAELEQLKAEHHTESVAREEEHRARLTALVTQIGQAEHQAQQQVDADVARRLREVTEALRSDRDARNADDGPEAAAVAEKLDAVKARVAPALANAAQVKKAAEAWHGEYAEPLAELRAMSREELLRGLPLVGAQATRSYGLAAQLQNFLELAEGLHTNILDTIRSQTATVNDLVRSSARRTDRQAWERELVQALHELAMASEESVAALHTYSKGITRTAAAISEMKAAHAGSPEAETAPSFINNAAVLEGLKKAERLMKNGGAPGPDHYDTSYSVFRN